MAESSLLSERHVFALGDTRVEAYGWMPVVTEVTGTET